MSRALAPYTKSIVGVDISEHMVNQYNKRVSDQGIPPEEMRAVAADLKGTEDELDGRKFDVVIVGGHPDPAFINSLRCGMVCSAQRHIIISEI